MEEYVLFLRSCRSHINEIVDAIDNSSESVIRQLIAQYVKELQLLITTWEENEILSVEQLTQLAGDFVDGLERFDLVYLRDALKYGFNDVINQLIGEEEANEET